MRNKRLFSACLLGALLLFAACAPGRDPDERAAEQLARRILSGTRGRVVFRKIDADRDCYEVRLEGRKLVIGGNNAGSMAVGLDTYLKTYCHIAVGWMDEGRAALPDPLPALSEPLRGEARVQDRFFLNYCTYGYTMPWWRWEDWERFIDWMALNGVNLPLAITGQEAVWHTVWTEMGLDDESVRRYFSGPSHLPWHRMVNIDRWGGPLPAGWLEGQAALQRRILSRERELGMRPVLPAFSGHVPPELKERYPAAKISRIEAWAGFDGEYAPSVLDPLDSLFPVIQQKFIEKQTALYGSDHIYGIDLFNEIQPARWDPEFLASAGRGTYASLAAADPDAVWLQMTWLFWYDRAHWTPERVAAYLTSYPASRSLLLDYYCEQQALYRQTENFYGVPHIWCYLGNFGGNTNLNGNLPLLDRRIEEALAEDAALQGIGCTLEALDCNPYVYEYVLSKAWKNSPAEAYAQLIADSRTGKADARAREAWKILLEEVYAKTTTDGLDNVLHLRPRTDLHLWWYGRYDNAALERALTLLEAVDADTPAARFDRINLRRQLLANKADGRYLQWQEAWRTGDLAAMRQAASALLSLADELDGLLSAHPYFRLDKWIRDARSWGKTEAERDYYERDARNLLTSWGDRGSSLTDYASRSLSGMMSSYYKVRWERFFAETERSLETGVPFDAEAFRQSLFDFEYDWWHSPHPSVCPSR